MRWNRSDLTYQYEWSGISLRNKRILVCPRCLDIPNAQLQSYSPPPDPIPIRDPRPDFSYMGNPPNIVYTVAQTNAQPVRDGFGNIVLDGYGNWVIAAGGTWGVLLPTGSGRTLVNFDLPASFGLWINPYGGPCAPGFPNCQFYAANTYFEEFGPICDYAITYFTTIAGLLVVVQSQGGFTSGSLPGQLTDSNGNPLFDSNGNPIFGS